MTTGTPPDRDQQQMTLRLLRVYVKDLSFESPKSVMNKSPPLMTTLAGLMSLCFTFILWIYLIA